MPNIKKFLERGAAQYDYEMIGGQPTVTPPMWTTLATGATAVYMALPAIIAIMNSMIFWNTILIPPTAVQSSYGM